MATLERLREKTPGRERAVSSMEELMRMVRQMTSYSKIHSDV